MTVNRGDIYGFIGKNGAGKTTLIRMAVGLAAPSGGSIELFGSKDLTQMRKKVGTVIEYPAVIPHMTARQNLVAQCKLQGVKDLSCNRPDFKHRWTGNIRQEKSEELFSRHEAALSDRDRFDRGARLSIFR